MGEETGIRSAGMTVGMLGAGTMGSGIATVMARAGHRTIVREVSHERAVAGVEQVRRFLDRSVERGKLAAAERDAATSGVRAAGASEPVWRTSGHEL